jgi:hypothetical protein
MKLVLIDAADEHHEVAHGMECYEPQNEADVTELRLGIEQTIRFILGRCSWHRVMDYETLHRLQADRGEVDGEA